MLHYQILNVVWAKCLTKKQQLTPL